MCRTRNTSANRAGHTPSRTAGVIVVLSPTLSTSTSWPRAGTEATTWPSGRTMPEMPLMAATTTQRPVSCARSRLISNCWASCPVRLNIALLVCTATNCAPLAT